VLKKREGRLKREQDGLKSLIAGLVGGPALLREWEREWTEKFGGEEKDEIEGDDAVGGSDDEDGDGDDSDGEEGEEGRVRKQPKVIRPSKKEKPAKHQLPPPPSITPGVVPEKRKRGRPRKQPLPPVISAPVTLQPMEGVVPISIALTKQQPQSQGTVVSGASDTQPAQQYLLAAFAFFSVLNSPLTSSFSRAGSASEHTSHGQVLTARPSMVSTRPLNLSTSPEHGINDLIQAFHILVSTVVLFYIVFPWFSGILSRNRLAYKTVQKLRSSVLWGYTMSNRVTTVHLKTHGDQYALLADALASSSRGTSGEATRLRHALGVTTGVLGLMQSVIKASKRDRGLELNQLEQRAWVRLGELIAFDGLSQLARCSV
jgi:hypothetical protein